MLRSLQQKLRHWRQRRAEKSVKKVAEDFGQQSHPDGPKTGTYWGE